MTNTFTSLSFCYKRNYNQVHYMLSKKPERVGKIPSASMSLKREVKEKEEYPFPLFFSQFL